MTFNFAVGLQVYAFGSREHSVTLQNLCLEFGKAFAGYRTFLCKSIHNPKLLLSENNPVIPSLETASLAAIRFIISRLICWLTLW